MDFVHFSLQMSKEVLLKTHSWLQLMSGAVFLLCGDFFIFFFYFEFYFIDFDDFLHVSSYSLIFVCWHSLKTVL